MRTSQKKRKNVNKQNSKEGVIILGGVHMHLLDLVTNIRVMIFKKMNQVRDLVLIETFINLF